jgi:hypothetical protein
MLMYRYSFVPDFITQLTTGPSRHELVKGSHLRTIGCNSRGFCTVCWAAVQDIYIEVESANAVARIVQRSVLHLLQSEKEADMFYSRDRCIQRAL